MDRKLIIDTIMERRRGIDMIARAHEPRTVFANPDRAPNDRGRAVTPLDLDTLAAGEPAIQWDAAYPEPAPSDRDISLKNRPDLKPAEERMSIASNRIHTVDPSTNLSHRLESGLEGSAMNIFKTKADVVGLQAQFGPVFFLKEGIWTHTFFDICADYASGRRTLYAVRPRTLLADLPDDLDLIRAQTLHNYAHSIELWTEEQISPAAIYRAYQILHARKAYNAANNRAVLATLAEFGGVARLGHVLLNTRGVEVSHAEDAVWSLIDRGVVVHDHPNADAMVLKRQSWIRAVGGAQ